MKRIVIWMLSVMMCVTAFAGCAENANRSQEESLTESSVEESQTAESSVTEESQEAEGSSAEEESQAEETASEDDAWKEEMKATFLEKADEVIVDEDTVTFTDASGDGSTPITMQKNPENVINLYASFTTLWYEAGGEVIGCIGGDSSVTLYEEYIGRDITQDEGMQVVATSSSGKKWDVESIVALQPDLIICSTAMSGYSTIMTPAESAGIPVIAVSYNDFSDYLKWFKVFCNLNDQPELWDSIALKALDDVVNVLAECPTEDTPSVFSMFAGAESLQANTSNTVVGGMITAMNAVNIVDQWENTTEAERLDINLETVFAADPDIILVQCHAGVEEGQEMVEATYGDNPVWQSLKAVQNGQVYYLEKELFHNKPNSRFAEAYQKLAEILYPDTTFSFQGA